MNVVESLSIAPGYGHRTTGSLDPSARLWVYGRAGKPCRKCGTKIRLRSSGADARLTYWCPQCQALPAGAAI
jgi:endonuclease-8